MNSILKTVKNGFYKIREWYDPTITGVSKPVERAGSGFYPSYVFNVYYGKKCEPIVVCADEPANWIGKTPESVAWDLHNYYVAKLARQKLKRNR